MSMERKRKQANVELNLSPMIDVVFLILIYFIVSLEMEPSLDDRLALSDARYSVKQDESALQIYVLRAALKADGSINPDSTGLIAFADRAGTPDSCLYCGLSFMKTVEDIKVPDSTTYYTKPYVIKTKDRLVAGGVPEIVDTSTGDAFADPTKSKEDIIIEGQILEGKNKFCSRCGNNILFVTLDMIPKVLEAKRDEVLEKLIINENIKRLKEKKSPLSEKDVDGYKKDMALMIKADAKTFYGRIIQVVERARSIGITKFAFVTSAESSWSQEHADMQESYTNRLISEGKIKKKKEDK